MSSKQSRRRAKAGAKAGRGREKRGRGVAFFVLAGAVVALAGWFTIRPFIGGDGNSDSGVVIVVEANMAGFRPKVLRAKVGERITVRLKSLDTRFHTDGGGKHQFAIDELGVNIIAPPKGSRETSFVVSEPGIYPYYCSICCGGKANPSMWGRLIVEA